MIPMNYEEHPRQELEKTVIYLMTRPWLLRLYAALFLVTSGCAHTQPICTTPCGMHVFGASCAVARRAEYRAINTLGTKVKTWTPEAVCEAVRGWKLRVHERVKEDRACPKTSWRLLPDGYLCVRGYTEDDTTTVWVMDGDLMTNAYTHELVHVVDLALGKKGGHCDWEARGVNDAVTTATGNADAPDEESNCLRNRIRSVSSESK